MQWIWDYRFSLKEE